MTTRTVAPAHGTQRPLGGEHTHRHDATRSRSTPDILADAADAVARVALERRELLLRVHRHRLGREDLEDCFSQAMLELIGRARCGPPLDGEAHIRHALEQKLLSRIHDRRRTLGGRGGAAQSAYRTAVATGRSAAGAGGWRRCDWRDENARADDVRGGDTRLLDVVDATADVHERVVARMELRRLRALLHELTPDQRLVICEQAGRGTGCREFCMRHGWSPEKFRKVGQRARARLAAARLCPVVPPASEKESSRSRPTSPLTPAGRGRPIAAGDRRPCRTTAARR